MLHLRPQSSRLTQKALINKSRFPTTTYIILNLIEVDIVLKFLSRAIGGYPESFGKRVPRNCRFSLATSSMIQVGFF